MSMNSKNKKQFSEPELIAKLFKIVNIALNCLLVITLTFFFSMAVSFLVTRTKYGIPSFLKISIIQVASGSMEDKGFEVGENILIKQKNIDSYSVGNYIAFFDFSDPFCPTPESVKEDLKPRPRAATNRIVFHEIVEIITDSNGDKWFRTKGSNNAFVDYNIIHENYVIGAYLETSESFANLLNFIFSIYGALVFVVLPCSIIICKDSYTIACIILELIELRKRKKDRETPRVVLRNQRLNFERTNNLAKIQLRNARNSAVVNVHKRRKFLK